MTSRRSFFSTIATAVSGFAILPPATTYARIWKAQRQVSLQYVTLPYETRFIFNPKELAGIWEFRHPFWTDLDAELDAGNRHEHTFYHPSDNHKFCLTESQP